MKQDHLLTPHTRINSKWIKGLNISLETIKKNHRRKHRQQSPNIACSNILSVISPQAREIKEEINKCDCMKLKSFAKQSKSTK